MSKIIRPAVTGVFPRKRLFGLLEGLKQQPVIWVAGPAGCGKTTLISSYVETRKIPCLWYQADAGDGDPATFFYYLRQAATKAAPRKRQPLPLLTNEYFKDIPTFAARYFEKLFGRLKIPSLIVFDNYQDVPTDSSLHDIMLQGLSGIPQGLNIILISRAEPPTAFIRMRANHLMEILGWDDLRLTLEESEGLIQLRARKELPPETAVCLHKAAGGWAAGMVLMLESMKRGMAPQMLGKRTPEEIVDYFASEILSKTDKDMQAFFLKTAFLPRMTTKMAEELTGLPYANRILATLSRNHYFTERRILEDPVYQYHPLYRDFLMQRARETLPADTLLDVCRRAARLLEGDGQLDAAIELYRDATDWNATIRLILTHAPAMVAQGRNRQLEAWITCLPKDLMETTPWLFYWMGLCQLPFDFSRSQFFLEKAFEESKNKEEVTGMFMSWALLVYAIWQEGKDFKRFDHWLRVIEDLLREHKEFPSIEIEAWVTLIIVAMYTFRQPSHPELDAMADRTLLLAETCSDPGMKIVTFFLLAYYRFNNGQMMKAAPLIGKLGELWPLQEASPLILITGKFMEAYFNRYIGKHQEVLKNISEGLALSQKTGVHVADHFFITQGAVSALNVHDFKTADAYIAMDEATFPRLSKLQQYCYYMQKTRRALTRKDSRQALIHADMALQVSTDIGSLLNEPFAFIIKSHVLHDLGRQEEAVDLLSRAFDMAHRAGNKLQQFYIAWARARFAFDSGEERVGLSFLKEASVIGKEEGIIETFIDHPPTMSMLCARALNAGIEIEYFQDLVRKRNLTAERPAWFLENWPWPLKIYALGRFEIWVNGTPIRFTRKAQEKPLSLLKTLIALGGKAVREESLADSLWSEAEGDAAHHAFEMTLHRLRSLVGNPEALPFKDGRLSLDAGYCWLDIWAFEQALAGADGHIKAVSSDKAAPLIQKAMDLYEGPFNAGEDGPPGAISLGERLRSRFLKGVNWLGRYWEQAGQYEKALDCYQRGLEADDLAEDLYRSLMRCHHRLGQRTEALSVYQRCRKILYAHFNTEPSLETRAIYKALLENVP